MLDISLHHIHKKYYEDTILDDVHFDIHSGEKIGLIGNNGAGKTTLYRIIVGEEEPTSGLVQVRKGIKLGYLPQVPSQYFDQTVFDVLHEPFRQLLTWQKEMQVLEFQMSQPHVSDLVIKRYGELQERFEIGGGYEMTLLQTRVIEGFKLKPLLQRPYQDLSGGEKTRVAIAKLLLESPDVLLLDEPTNHLDTDMLEWLEGFLTRYEGAVVIISHDRYFLDQTVEKIVEITFGKSLIYHGNYSLFTMEKEARLERERKAFKEQQRTVKSIKEAIKRFRTWGEQADNAKFFAKAKQFEKRLEEMAMLERPDAEDHRFELALLGAKKSAKRMVVAKGIKKAYDGKTLFEDLDFEIHRGEKVCLMGKNGTGKTTIMRAIQGDLNLDGGQLVISESATMGYLEQEVTFEDPMMKIVDYFKEAALLTEGQARNMLAHFGFKGEEVFRSVASMSGGEKSRIQLALLGLSSYQIMLLDEPTNHLDIQSKEQLENTLQTFEGSVFFISHDRYFINMIADRILWLEEGNLYSNDGNYDDYLNHKERRMRQEEGAIENTHKTPQIKPASEEPNPTKTKPKKLNLFKLNQLEGEIEALEGQIADLTSALEGLATDFIKFSQVESEIVALRDVLHDKMELWLTYQEQ